MNVTKIIYLLRGIGIAIVVVVVIIRLCMTRLSKIDEYDTNAKIAEYYLEH